MNTSPQPPDGRVNGRLPRWTTAERTRVLYIDDHPDSLDLIGFVLGDAGLHCSVANTFAEAGRIMRKTLFDLYIVDHRLPDGSGIDFIRQIRQQDRNTPVIFVSADAQSSVQKQALQVGADSAFTKPFDPFAILRSAKQRIAGARMKSLQARIEERAAILDTLTEQARLVATTLADARAAIRRAHEIRSAARTAFLRAGGSPADFPRLWDASMTLGEAERP